MSIEFIRDEFLEGKKQELDDINRIVTERPKKVDRSVLFLRRFTLALLGQYNVKHHKKSEEIEMLNKQIVNETKKIHEFRRPIQRLMPTPPQRLQVPVPTVPRPMSAPVGRVPIEKVEKKNTIPTPV